MKKLSFSVMFILALFSSGLIYAQTPYNASLSVGANMLFGDFKKVYKSGASIEIGIFYEMPKTNMELSFSVGYNAFKYENEYFSSLVLNRLDEAVVNFYPDWSMTDIPFMIGAKYKFPSEGISPYVSGEIGVHFVSFTDRFNGNRLLGNDTLRTVTFTNVDNCTESKSVIGLGASLGAGFEIPVAPTVTLDFGLKYKYCGIAYFKSFEVLTSSGLNFINPELKNITYLTIKAGVIVDF